MNILPKKKWHVRTKENIARVRRDEAKAAEEEQKRLDRAILAENERRLEALRNQAVKRDTNLEPFTFRSSTEAALSSSTGHVNLFQDLEMAERKNFEEGNKEYKEEKRKEQAEWDSKMGIQKSFAEGTNELNKVQEWYEKVSRPWIREKEKVQARAGAPHSDAVRLANTQRTNEEKVTTKVSHGKRKRESSSHSESSDSKDKAKKKRKKKKKKKHKHLRDSSSEEKDSGNIEEEIEKRNRLAALREERLRRERAERHRVQQLLNPTKTAPAPKPKYNSMFNPELCKK